MLIEFSVGNYKSFKEKVTFSMAAANITARDKAVDLNNTFTVTDKLRLLSSSAIYGANASGKSNLTLAFWFMRWFVLNSSKATQASELIGTEPFGLSAEALGKPSFFQVVFLVDGTQYKYGFEVNRERVASEWLSFVPRTREAKLFERKLDNIVLQRPFKEGKGIETKTRSNSLFLSVVAQFNGQISQSILRWFQDLSVVSGLNPDALRSYTVDNFVSDKFRDEIVQLVKELDLGIEDIQVEQIGETADQVFLPAEMPENEKARIRKLLRARLYSPPETLIIRTIHRMFDSKGKYSPVMFDLDNQESEGTKKLFALAGPLFDTLRGGKVLVIDELDGRLHPLITKAIIRLFNSRETNTQNAQLIFTTHDTNLLSNKILRRDQVWFTEKDEQGSTHLYSLVEFKGVRNDASLESDYIRGKYGAIPFIGDLETILG